MRRTTLSSFLLLALVPACDQASDDQTLRELLDVELDQVEISLQDAIAEAEAEVPGATVIEADLDLEHGMTLYDVELYLDGVEYEVYVSPQDGSIVQIEQEALDADDRAEAEAAAALVLASPGWAALIETAEASAGGTAFEAEADGDDGVLEIEVLADVIWEVELNTAGDVVKSEIEDDDEWEAEEESEDDDDDTAGDDDGPDDDGLDEDD